VGLKPQQTDFPCAVSPNKHMQRAVTHKVLGRGRPILVPWSSPRARVLTGQRAGADVGRWAALKQWSVIA
jgi:hypothetical protein